MNEKDIFFEKQKPIIEKNDCWKYAYCPKCNNKLTVGEYFKKLKCTCGYSIETIEVNW